MKLSISFSTLLLVLPALVSASSIPVHVRGLNGDLYMPRNHARHYGRQRQGGFRGGGQSPQGNANKNKSSSGSATAQATSTGASVEASTESCPEPTTVTVTAGGAAATTDAATTSTTAAAATSTSSAAGGGNKNKNKANTTSSSTSTSASSAGAGATTDAATTSTSSAAGRGNRNKNKGNTTSSSTSTSSAAASAGTDTSTSTSAGTDNSTSTSTSNAAAATVASTNGTNSDPQTSLTLLSNLVETGLENDGQQPPVAGQVASLTSSNNFINFCVGKTITNGQQVTGGSCNPIPMGDIVPKANMPSCKFASPANQDTIPANQAFTIKMNINNMQAGVFTNAQKTYYMAPQQLNGQGILIGHSHFVIQKMTDFADPAILDPATFAFFKGINTAAQGGQLSADVTAGLPAGKYRLASINTDANHAPAIVAVAQHGWLDDIVYFTVQ